MNKILLEVRASPKSFGRCSRATMSASKSGKGRPTPSSVRGAGKTTLISAARGRSASDRAGALRGRGHHGALGTGARAPRIRALFPDHQHLPDFTALENVMLAVQAHSGSSFRFWRPARGEASLRSPASAILEEVG